MEASASDKENVIPDTIISDSSLRYSTSSMQSLPRPGKKVEKPKNFEAYIAKKLQFLNQKTKKLTFDLETGPESWQALTSPIFRSIITPKTDIAWQIKNLQWELQELNYRVKVSDFERN